LSERTVGILTGFRNIETRHAERQKNFRSTRTIQRNPPGFLLANRAFRFQDSVPLLV
jgi:hypothetical protein